VSVLTETRNFSGSLLDMIQISSSLPGIPLLRKDFIFDRYQLLEARLAGASAVLLIASALTNIQLALLVREALDLRMSPLVEVHDMWDLEKTLAAGATLIGVNNRDLRDFNVSLETSLSIRPHIPPGCTTVSESGIRSREHAIRLAEMGFDAILVGEALLCAEDLPALTRELSGVKEQPTPQSGDRVEATSPDGVIR
jgi:indole-3-glycerol phosphate synthase